MQLNEWNVSNLNWLSNKFEQPQITWMKVFMFRKISSFTVPWRQQRLVGSAKEQYVQQMNVKMKMQDNVCDDVRTAGFHQYTQYARSLTWRRHNMPIHTIAPTPPLHFYTSTIHKIAPTPPLHSYTSTIHPTRPYFYNSHTSTIHPGYPYFYNSHNMYEQLMKHSHKQ